MKRSIRHMIFNLIAVLSISLVGLSQDLSTTQIVGGPGGVQFSDTAVPSGARVLEVRVNAGNYVDALQVVYLLPDGRVLGSSPHGGTGGDPHIIRLDSDEHITGISGRYGNYIDSIRIHTNKRTSALFGGSGGDDAYRIMVPVGNQGMGFSGRSGNYIDAIGLTWSPTWIQPSGRTETAGGTGGDVFSDNRIPSGARISAVYVWAGNYVDRIQLIYTLRNGSFFEGEAHGGGGGKRNVFSLDADEYITGISGRHGNYIDSLIIHTNKRKSPKYGGQGGDKTYNLEIPARYQAVGFMGSAGKYVDSIGLEYGTIRQPLRNNERQRRNRIRDWRQ